MHRVFYTWASMKISRPSGGQRSLPLQNNSPFYSTCYTARNLGPNTDSLLEQDVISLRVMLRIKNIRYGLLTQLF